jgi:hypothetical protein
MTDYSSGNLDNYFTPNQLQCDYATVFPILYPNPAVVAAAPWVGRFCASAQVWDGGGEWWPVTYSAGAVAGTPWSWLSDLPAGIDSNGWYPDAQEVTNWLDVACPASWLSTVYGGSYAADVAAPGGTPHVATGSDTSEADSAGYGSYCDVSAAEVAISAGTGYPADVPAVNMDMVCNVSAVTATELAGLPGIDLSDSGGVPYGFFNAYAVEWPYNSTSTAVLSACDATQGPPGVPGVSLVGQVLTLTNACFWGGSDPLTGQGSFTTGTEPARDGGGWPSSFQTEWADAAGSSAFFPYDGYQALVESYVVQPDAPTVPAAPTEYFPGGSPGPGAGGVTPAPAVSPEVDTPPATVPELAPLSPPLTVVVPAGPGTLPLSSSAAPTQGSENAVGNFLANAFDTATDAVADAVNAGTSALTSSLTWLGSSIDTALGGLQDALQASLDAVQVAVNAVDSDVQTVGLALGTVASGVEDVAADIAALPSLIVTGLESALEYLFIPSSTTESDLQSQAQSTFPITWVDTLTGGVSAVVSGAVTGLSSGACGPYIGWSGLAVPSWGVRLPAPSTSGCAGNGPAGARTVEDNDAGDLFGWRTDIRGALLVFMTLGFVIRIVRSGPWSSSPDDLAPNVEV